MSRIFVNRLVHTVHLLQETVPIADGLDMAALVRRCVGGTEGTFFVLHYPFGPYLDQALRFAGRAFRDPSRVDRAGLLLTFQGWAAREAAKLGRIEVPGYITRVGDAIVTGGVADPGNCRIEVAVDYLTPGLARLFETVH